MFKHLAPKELLKKTRHKLNSDLHYRLSILEERERVSHNTILAALNELRSQLSTVQTVKVSDDEVVTKIFTGLKMYLNPKDVAVGLHIALDGVWEEYITKAWMKVQKAETVVFDVGANFGYYGLLSAQALNRQNSKIVFFEANPYLAGYIERSLSTNFLNTDSTVEPLAVSDISGFAKLSVLKDYIGCSSLHTLEHLNLYLHDEMKLEVDEVIEVETITIDEYCEKNSITRIDLMKLDIEGFEEKAYQGMKRIINKSSKMILFIEFTQASYKKPKQFFKKLCKDFNYLYLIDSSGEIVGPKSYEYDEVIGSGGWTMLIFSKVRINA